MEIPKGYEPYTAVVSDEPGKNEILVRSWGLIKDKPLSTDTIDISDKNSARSNLEKESDEKIRSARGFFLSGFCFMAVGLLMGPDYLNTPVKYEDTLLITTGVLLFTKGIKTILSTGKEHAPLELLNKPEEELRKKTQGL